MNPNVSVLMAALAVIGCAAFIYVQEHVFGGLEGDGLTSKALLAAVAGVNIGLTLFGIAASIRLIQLLLRVPMIDLVAAAPLMSGLALYLSVDLFKRPVRWGTRALNALEPAGENQ